MQFRIEPTFQAEVVGDFDYCFMADLSQLISFLSSHESEDVAKAFLILFTYADSIIVYNKDIAQTIVTRFPDFAIYRQAKRSNS